MDSNFGDAVYGPVPSLGELAGLTVDVGTDAGSATALGVPVATGERIHTLHEYRELFELHAADIIQPDISHFGGILHTKKLAAWADTYYVLIAPHNVGGPVATAAATSRPPALCASAPPSRPRRS